MVQHQPFGTAALVLLSLIVVASLSTALSAQSAKARG